MINWIVDDVSRERTRNLPKFDIDYIDQNSLQGLHRTGWPYVLTFMRIFHSNKGILCDTFADRTFLWGRSILVESGILPYTSMWIGFIHHTPNNEYTDNNCLEIIKSEEFLQSLPTCQAIVCLSEYLSNWFRDRFRELGVKVPVMTLYHPTIFCFKYMEPKSH